MSQMVFQRGLLLNSVLTSGLDLNTVPQIRTAKAEKPPTGSVHFVVSRKHGFRVHLPDIVIVLPLPAGHGTIMQGYLDTHEFCADPASSLKWLHKSFANDPHSERIGPPCIVFILVWTTLQRDEYELELQAEREICSRYRILGGGAWFPRSR